MAKDEINFFGLTNFRNQRKKFGIRTDDRRRHFYCIGKTGMGKSNLMENMAIQDIQAGRGVAYVDPHGEGAEKLLDFVPANRINDVIFFNPADLDYPIAFNVMEKVDFRYRHLVAGGLMGVFKKVWPDVWSARMEYILNNSILALLEYPDSTLLGVNRMLADPEYRDKVVAKIEDPIVKAFWTTEYARYTQRYEIEATAAIQNKVGQFISNPLIRNIIGQTKSTIDMRDIMDKEKIFIMDLSKGRIGEDNSRLIGALLITKIQLAAMSRVDIPEDDRKDFYLYVDEFQNFATESFSNILSEARKYRLNITLGHQYINQMEEEVRDAVFGNVGTMAVFRVGAEDAEFLEREFTPEFTAVDLVNLPKYNVYLKLMINGVAGHPFSAETLPPPLPLEVSNRDKIIKASRERYGVRREIVDEKISRWSGIGEDESVGVPGSMAVKPIQAGANTARDTKGRVPDKRDRPRAAQPVIQQNLIQPRNDFSGTMSDQPGQTTLYDAVCSNCGKPTKVIFPPEKGRAVYCKSCLKKLKAGQITTESNSSRNSVVPPSEKPILQQEQPAEPAKIENVPFYVPRDKAGSQKSGIAKPLQKTPRKEINLSDLRKALEASLSKKDEEEFDGNDSADVAEKKPESELEERIEEEKEMDKEMGEDGDERPDQSKPASAVESPGQSPDKQNNGAEPDSKKTPTGSVGLDVPQKKEIKPGETIKL